MGMAGKKTRMRHRSDGPLPVEVIRRIDRLVGAEGGNEFIRSAVEHALFMEEYLSAHRAKCLRQPPSLMGSESKPEPTLGTTP